MKEFTECCTVIAEGEIIKESLNASAEEVFWGISDGDEVELHMIL